MKKQALIRAMLGTPWALVMGVVIIIIVSLIEGTGEIVMAPPGLVARLGEIGAFAAQCAATMLYGAIWSAASVVWETDWSLLKQTLVHLACCALSAWPIVWLMYWIPHTLSGIAGYLLMFTCIYILVWLSQYLPMRHRIRAMNAKLCRE